VLRPTCQIIYDDVRIQNNGKVLVVGMYLDTVIVHDPNAPIVLAFLELFETNEAGLFHTSVQLAGLMAM